MENIALTITLNGVTQTVNSIEELERAILEAKQELQKFAGTQDEFKRFNAQVTQLEGTLKRIKATRTQELVGAFAKIGSTVTASFATAQAALNLFGIENENVTKAAAQAQNLLTVALGLRQIAENLTTISSAKLTIATYAEAQATTAASAATRLFFNLLKTNPFALIATAIFGVVTALSFLGTKNDEETERIKKLKEAYDGAAKTIDGQILKSELLFDRINALTTAFEQGRIAFDVYEDGLKNLVPGFEDLDLTLLTNRNALKRYTEELEKLNVTNIKIAEAEKLVAEFEKNNEKFKALQYKNEIQRLTLEQAERVASVKGYKTYIENIIQGEKDREQAAKDAEENRRKRQLEEIKRNNDLLKVELERLKNQQSIAKLEVQFATAKQLSQLEALTQSTDEYLSVLEKQGKLTESLFDQDLKSIEEAQSKITNSGKKIQNINTLIKKGFTEAATTLEQSKLAELLKEKLDITEGLDIPLDRQIANYEEVLSFEKKFVDDFVANRLRGTQLTGEALDLQTEGLRDAGTNLFNILVENQNALNQYDLEVTNTTESLNKLTQAVNDLSKSQAAQTGFIKQNADAIVQQFDVELNQGIKSKEKLSKFNEMILKKDFDFNREYAADIISLTSQLEAQGLDVRNASYEVKFELLKKFLEKELGILTEAEDEKQKKIEETVNKIEQSIAALQAALTAVSQTFTDLFAFQLDQLEKRYSRIQDTIVGDTEAANQKRLDAEKAYQGEKAILEKRAAKTSLQIQRVQALANVAEAITKAFTAGPLVGQIAAGIVAAAGLAQVGIITAQINSIDSYRKGGILKRQGGGLVKGPAHEYGGVKFQGGGIELEGNEAIINRVSTIRYGELLNQINLAGGGSPIVNNFDDSRIVEAIARQRMEPIRAYVVESDITNKQQVARRLELLSQI